MPKKVKSDLITNTTTSETNETNENLKTKKITKDKKKEKKQEIKIPIGDTRKKTKKTDKQDIVTENELIKTVPVPITNEIKDKPKKGSKKGSVQAQNEISTEPDEHEQNQHPVLNQQKEEAIQNEQVVENIIQSSQPTEGEESTTSLPQEIPTQKKRGRRPKVKTEEELNKIAAQQTIKKKGKNPKESLGVNDDFEEDDPFFNQQEPEKECLETPIMRLNVTAADIRKIKDPNVNLDNGDNELNIPFAYNSNVDFNYASLNEIDINQQTYQPQNNSNNQNQSNTRQPIDIDIQKIRSTREKELESVDSNNESKLLNQYIEHNKKETWPEKSLYDCMWCRFSFDNTPWAIPYRLTSSDKFEVFGNFCSPNCAAAYIFDTFDDDELWDRYALLNMLFQRVYNTPGAVVKPAPDVLFLKKLGGILTIEEFREISGNNNRNLYLKMPPMISIIPSVEEIQQTSLFNENTNREHLNKELMMKANDELRLRRAKPIYYDTNTLDNYFHISTK
jgi:hypothetical protein